MALISRYFEIPIKELSDRLDVTYYSVKAETKQKSYGGSQLKDLGTHIRTRTPAREIYVDEGTSCLKLRNVTGTILNPTDCDCIPDKLRNQYVRARQKDILVTATGEGTAGRADIFIEPNYYIVTGENILIRPSSINPFYLLAILRTQYISKQLSHFVRGATGQTHLYWQDIEIIKIPDTDDKIKEKCEHIYREAWSKRRAAREKILAAKSVITKVMFTSDFNVHKRALTFETYFDFVSPTHRFDVEYFQPIHNTMKEMFIKSGCIPISSVVQPNINTINPAKTPSKEFRYIDIANINTETGDFLPITLQGHQAPTRARRKPNKNDIIVSTVRPNRNAIALIDVNVEDIVVSTGFTVLTPTKIDPIVLFAMLKTESIYTQLVRNSRTAMYPAVTDDDILNILIPELSDKQIEQVIPFCRPSAIMGHQRGH